MLRKCINDEILQEQCDTHSITRNANHKDHTSIVSR